MGAVDYIHNPYDLDVLVARIKSNIRQNQKDKVIPQKIIQYHNLTINIGNRTATLSGKILKLTKLEFELLRYLAN